MQKIAKRSLSALLALMMVITMLSCAFTVSADAIDVQIASWDEGQGHTAAAGPSPNSWPTDVLEGANGLKLSWAGKEGDNLTKLYLTANGLDFDITEGSYLALDLYISGVTYNNIGGTDVLVRMGTGNDHNSADVAVFRNGLKNASKTWKEGWNHMLIPLQLDDGTAIVAEGVKCISLIYEKSVLATTDSYIIVDDYRIVNEEGLASLEKRNAAKDVTIAIRALPAVAELTLDDKAAVDAAAAAYAALDESYKSLVKGVDTLTAAQAKIAELTPDVGDLIAQINALDDEELMFNNADAQRNEAGTEIIANVNSSSLDFAMETENKTEGTASAKYSLKNAGTTDFPLMFRGDAVNPKNYDYLQFDLYLSEGMTVTGTWGNTHFQTGWDNSMDANLAKSVPSLAIFQTAVPGQWVTMQIPCSDIDADVNQITLRAYENYTAAAAGDYLLVDNMKYVATTSELTWEDNDKVMAAKAAYDALDAATQALVTNADVLAAAVAKMEELAPNLTDLQFRSADTPGWQNTPRGEFFNDTTTYTEGTGSIRAGLDYRSGTKLMNAWLGSIDNRNANTDTIDITKAIDENGDFYITLDLWADPAKIDELNAGRFVVGVIAYTENQPSTTDLGQNKEVLQIDKAQNADWSVWGIEKLQPGWNHLATKVEDLYSACNALHPSNAMETYWDSSKVWGIKFNYQQLNWEDAEDFTYSIRFDDIRFMSVEAYEANFAARNQAKDVVVAINAIEGLTDIEGINAAKNAYDALTDAQKAQVSNAAKLEEYTADPEDLQLSSMDTTAMIVIPGGNTGGTDPANTQGIIYTDNYVEGTASNRSHWGTVEVGKSLELRMGLVGLGGVDLSKYTYLVFDMYVHGFTHNWVNGTNDCNVGFGTGDAWNSVDLGYTTNSIVGPVLNNLQEGWNHVAIPISQTGNNANVLIFYSTAATATVTDPYVLFDDIRLMNETGLVAEADRTAAKAVIAQIAQLKAGDTAAIAAAKDAYAALTETQKAYVTNYARIAELEAAVVDAAAVESAITAIAGGTSIVFHACETGDYAIDYTTNSSKSLAEGQGNGGGNALKFTQTAATTQEFCVAVNVADAIPGAGIAAVQFDLYLSEGMSFKTDAATWPSLAVKSESNANPDAPLAAPKVALYDYLKDCKTGWNTIVIPIAPNEGASIKELFIRFYHMFNGAPNEYLMLDNVELAYAANEITYADKALIDGVKAQYDALSDDAKSLVTNYAVLEAHLAAMTAEETAAAAVVNEINALPPVSSEDPEVAVLVLGDKPKVVAARTNYDALAADTKPLVTNLAVLDAAEARIDALEEDSDDAAVAKVVTDQIAALPETVVVTDEAAIVAARAAYDALSEDQKILVEGYAKLQACETALAQAKLDNEAAQSIIEAINQLPSPATAADKEAVDAAKKLYDDATAGVQSYVTNYSVLEAAVAAVAQDEADIAAAKAVSDAIATLPEEVTVENMAAVQAVKAQYDALNANAQRKLTEDEVATLDAAYTASLMLAPIDVQFRALDSRGPDTSVGGSAQADKNALEAGNQLEGEKALVYTWTSAKGGTGTTTGDDAHFYLYHYKQSWDQDVTEDGTWAVPVPSALTGEMYVTFDMYVSDVDVLKGAKGDCGFNFDTEGPNAWGNGGSSSKTNLMGQLEKDGWNHVELPLSFVGNYSGKIMNVYDLRIYFCGLTVPEGFVVMLDDVRFMSKQAVETIQPLRVAAKQVTMDIRALADEYTYEEGKAIVKAYNAVDVAYKDLVIGYDEFYTAYAEKFAAEIAADLAADKAAAQEVIDAIDDATLASDLFNDCDEINETWSDDEGNSGSLEVIANLNSGGDNKEIAEGAGVDGGNAAKFIKKVDANIDFNEAFRSVNVWNLRNYTALEFDLYLSEGMTTGVEGGWANVYFNKAYANNNDDHKVSQIPITDLLADLKVGEWNHVVIPMTAKEFPLMFRSEVCQLSLRFYQTFSGATGEYIMIDNISFSGLKTITVDDAEALAAANGMYDALTAEQKALVSNYDTLVAANNALKEAQDAAAIENVETLIAALPETIAVENKAAVDGAKAAYDALSDELKADVDADLVAKLNKAVADLADAEKAAAVDTLIEAFPAEITPANAEQVNAAKAAYDALTAEQKALVKEANVTALNAALEAIKAPEYTLGDVNGDGAFDAKDALIVLKIAVDKYDATETEKAASNVNKDNAIDAKDALEILKKAVGKPACF